MKADLKFNQKPWKNNKYEGFYTFLSCQDNATYFENPLMFKQMITTSSNIPSLEAADKN